MAAAHSSSPSPKKKAFLMGLCFLFCAAHSSFAAEFSKELFHSSSFDLPVLHDPGSTSTLSSSNSRNSKSPLKPLDDNYDFSAEVESNGREYLAWIYVGSHNKDIPVIVSTTSDLLWFKCFNCKNCYETPSYQSFKSSISKTFHKLEYDSLKCNNFPNSLDDEGMCWIFYKYEEKVWVGGFLSEDKIRFIYGGVAVKANTFACIHRTKGTFSPESLGNMGLSRRWFSLATQMGKRISICLSVLLTTKGWVNFGSLADASGTGAVTTPLVPHDRYYKITLVGIIVENAEHDPNRIDPGDNIVISSAGKISYIGHRELEKLIKQVRDNTHLRTVENHFYRLCFDIKEVEFPWPLPWITLVFNGNAEMHLNPYNVFVMMNEHREAVCLAFKSNAEIGVSVLGTLAFMGSHIAIHPDEGIVTIRPGQCI